MKIGNFRQVRIRRSGKMARIHFASTGAMSILALMAYSPAAVTALPVSPRKAPRTPEYTVTDLGEMPNLPNIFATAASPDFKYIVGCAYERGSFETEPFRWSAGKFTILPHKLGQNIPHAVSASGTAVGDYTEDGFYYYEAIEWKIGKMRSLFATTDYAKASAVDSRGTIYGDHYPSQATTSHSPAYLHYTNGKTEYPRLGPNFRSQFRCRNTRGMVVLKLHAVRGSDVFDRKAVEWDGSTFFDLPPPESDAYFSPNAMNDRDEIVGQFWTRQSALPRAFIWRKRKPAFLPISGYAIPQSINNEGEIVGVIIEPGTSPQRPFVLRKGALTDLNVAIGRKDFLSGVQYIDDRGRILAYGKLAGKLHSYILAPVSARTSNPQ